MLLADGENVDGISKADDGSDDNGGDGGGGGFVVALLLVFFLEEHLCKIHEATKYNSLIFMLCFRLLYINIYNIYKRVVAAPTQSFIIIQKSGKKKKSMDILLTVHD